MTIYGRNRDFDIECDFCGMSTESDADSWQGMIEDIKAQGWRTFKKDGEWVQKCASCIERSRG